jgi:hypothetical protein
VLDEAAVQVEQERRAEHGEDQAARVAEEYVRHDAADEGPGETETDRHRDAHRVRARERKPRERADDQGFDDEHDDEPENHGRLS